MNEHLIIMTKRHANFQILKLEAKEMHEIMEEQSIDGICDPEADPQFDENPPKSRANIFKRSISSLIDAGRNLSKWISGSSLRSLPPNGLGKLFYSS